MKRIALSLFLSAWVFGYVAAQNPKSARIDAALSYRTFQENPSQVTELKRAKENIDFAAAHEKMQDDGQTFRLKANIYASLAMTEAGLSEYPEAAVQAYEAAIKAMEIEEAAVEKKGKPKNKMGSQNEFREMFPNIGFALYNAGVDAYQAKKYQNAYDNFSRILNIRSRCAEITDKKPLNFKRGNFELKEAEVLPLAAQSALAWGMEAKSNDALAQAEKLLKNNKSILNEKDGGNLYARLVTAYNQNGKISEAKRLLDEARKDYPNHFDLLLAKINMAAADGKLAEVETELQEAVKKDPSNAELSFALGGVYYQLMNDGIVTAEGKADKNIKPNMDKALAWYDKTLKTNPKHFGAVYNTAVVNILYSNYLIATMENMKINSDEYKKTGEESDQYFDRGVAKLHEAEAIDNTDLMLLNSLKEVYGKKNKIEEFKKYKALFEAQQAKMKN